MPVQMEYRLVKGFREGSEMLYVPSEKCLYRFKRRRNGARDFICYQTLLSKPTKKKPARDEDRCECNASVRLYPNGTCKKRNDHIAHNNHEGIMRDMDKANEMKEKCKTLKHEFAEDSHKISSRNIFQRVIAKYVCLLSVCPSVRPSLRFYIAFDN